MEQIFPHFQENDNNQDFDFDNKIINKNNYEIDDINEESSNYQIIQKNYNLSKIKKHKNNKFQRIPALYQVKNNSFKNHSNQ